MLKHHLVVALRRLRREPFYAVLNVSGLALGMTAFLLIGLYVRDELGYDRFHERADRLVRVTRPEAATTPAPLGPALVASVPGAVTYTRILPTLGDVLVKNLDGDRYYEQRFYFADSTTFDVFTVPLLQADPQSALAGVGRVVIAEHVARRYFGDADPMGRRLVLDVGFEAELTVTGVMAGPPANSHFRPDFLASMATFASLGMLDFDDWGPLYYHTYLVLDRAAAAADVGAALPAVVPEQVQDSGGGFRVQPVTQIHLAPPLEGELEPSGSASTVVTFAGIALLILLIAAINFVNLTTARLTRRIKAAGIRGVLGASRRELARSPLAEAVLLATAAAACALPLVYAGLPLFNAVTDKALVPGRAVLLGIVGLVGIVGLGAGIYPALAVLRSDPFRLLRGTGPSGPTGLGVRRLLVVLQFTAGIVLIAGTLVIQAQLRYVGTRDLGLDAERTVVVAARMYGHGEEPLPFEAIGEAFAAHPGVRAVAATGDVPGTAPRRSPFFPEGLADRDAMTETTWNDYTVDFDLVETLGLEVVAGRTFERDRPADEQNAYVINEAAARAARDLLGAAWDDPVGRRLDRYVRLEAGWMLAEPGRVIGVVRDFHYASLHQRIAPMVLRISRGTRDHLVVRLHGGNVTGTVAHLESVWQRFVPERPFEFYFLDGAFAQQYRQDRRTATLMSLFSGLSLVIAALGLFGLTACTAEQRTREVGIRRVLGASTAQLVRLLSGDLVRLVVLAFFAAVPVAYLAMQRWLDGFAYRVEISWRIFLMAGLVALLVALITVGYQSVRAALADPVESLRRE